MMQAATGAVAEDKEEDGSHTLLLLMAVGKTRGHSSLNIRYLLWQRGSFRYGNNEQAFFCSSHQSSLWTFIHLVVCLTKGPKPLPKRALHIVRSRVSSSKWEYPLISLRSSNSFLCLLPYLPVTSIPPCIFPSMTRCRRQFLRKMWPIQFAFRLRISCTILLCSLTLSNTSSFLTWSVPSSNTTSQNFPGVSDLLNIILTL